MYADNGDRIPCSGPLDVNQQASEKSRWTINLRHNITPESIIKEIDSVFESVYESDYVTVEKLREEVVEFASPDEIEKMIRKMEKEMAQAAKKLEFEKAAEIRDRIRNLRKTLVFDI